MTSLNRRLLTSVLLLLLVFFGITVAALDLIFRDLSERSLREFLDGQLIALIASSDPNDHGEVIPAGTPTEARLSQPGSGLYSQIRTREGRTLWQSQSTVGTDIDFGSGVAPGARRYERRQLADGTTVMALASGLSWEIAPEDSRDFVFSVATDLAPYEAQMQRFRGQMLGWFTTLAILLLLALAVLLRWVLGPVRRLEREIREIEGGERRALGAGVPQELAGIVANLNALLDNDGRRLERYRNTLGNLAHSLKTPLAVMRTTLSADTDPQMRSRVLNEQIDRMDDIVQHQLKRAGASGGAMLGHAAMQVDPLLTELRAALNKVYASKDLLIEVAAEPGAQFAGDRGDLFELLGNLLDNACKWCRSRVRVDVKRAVGSDGRSRLAIRVEDDGAGIAVADRNRILERGARADEQVPGQGLGLAMVKEIVELYDGRLAIGDSPLGGALIDIELPGR
jgi:two-component system, OmpR family, sensor histidine kinase PhoQ